MKKIIAFITVSIICLCACACGGGGTSAGGSASDGSTSVGASDGGGYTQLLADVNYKKGFNLFGCDSRFHGVNYWEQLFFADSADPVWKLGTWGCFNNYFLDRELTVVEGDKTFTYPKRALNTQKVGDVYTISNDTYTVKANPTEGAVTLILDSSQEFGKIPSYTDAPRISAVRQSGEAWPHLLIEENTVAKATIGEMSELVFSLDFKIGEVQMMMDESDFDSSLHSAQVTWYVSIACINPSSASYNKYIWFGIPIYDYRYKTQPERYFTDGGKDDATGMLIYSANTEEYLPTGVEIGTEYSINCDFYAKAVRAFAIAQERGLFGGCTLNDMRIINTNIGWEHPGSFKTSIELSGMSIKYKTK